jgi:hypothetical protein
MNNEGFVLNGLALAYLELLCHGSTRSRGEKREKASSFDKSAVVDPDSRQEAKWPEAAGRRGSTGLGGAPDGKWNWGQTLAESAASSDPESPLGEQ